MNDRPMTEADRATKSAAAMWAADRASQTLGMIIEAVGPGRATLSMPLRDDMLNGHGIAHGGFIFTLADSAFAFACNSYNTRTVAVTNQITYVTPAQAGDTLTADAVEVHRAGRSGTYDVTVTNQTGTTIALFRGHSRTINGQHFEED